MIGPGQKRMTREEFDRDREVGKMFGSLYSPARDFLATDEQAEFLWTERTLVQDSPRFMYSPLVSTAVICLVCGAVVHQGLVAVHETVCKTPNHTATRSEPRAVTLDRWRKRKDR
jgi:hypothetical protein